MTGGVSSAVLAGLFGLSERTVRDLATRGVITKAGRGTYDLAESVRRYCEHLREVAAGRGGEGQVLDLAAERARLAKEQADHHAMRNALTRGEMIEAETVAREWGDVLRGVRATMLAVPSRVQARLPHLTATDVAALDREVRDALAKAGRDDAS